MYKKPKYIEENKARDLEKMYVKAEKFIDGLVLKDTNQVFVNRVFGVLIYKDSGWIIVEDYSKAGRIYAHFVAGLTLQVFEIRISRSSSVKHAITHLPGWLARDINFLTFLLSNST